MARMRVSRRAPLLVLLLGAAFLPACATTSAEDEIRKLEARSSYEAGVKSIAVSWGHQTVGSLMGAAPDHVVRLPEELIEVTQGA